MTTTIKTCGCGRSFTLAQWNDLPDCRVYRLDADDAESLHEQRRCPCGSHIIVPIVNGQPHAVDRAGNLVPAPPVGIVFVAGLFALALTACGGAPFSSSLEPALLHAEAGEDAANAPDADPVEGGSDAADAGSDVQATADAGADHDGSHDAGPDVLDAGAGDADDAAPDGGTCSPVAIGENQECAAHQPGGQQPFVYAVYCGASGAPGCPMPFCQPPAPTPVECLCDYTCACILAHCTGYCCQTAGATCAKGSTFGVMVTCNP